MKRGAGLFGKPVTRYVIVGGLVYGLEMVVIMIAQRLGSTAIEAVVLSFSVGLAVSFLLQKLFTFGDKRMHHKVIVPQAVAVTLLVFFNLGFTVLVTKLLQDVLSVMVIRTIALVLTTIWNFYLYKTHIFKRQYKGERYSSSGIW